MAADDVDATGIETGDTGTSSRTSTSDLDKRHPIEYAIDGTTRWWQSPTLLAGKEFEYVTITLDLKQVGLPLYHNALRIHDSRKHIRGYLWFKEWPASIVQLYKSLLGKRFWNWRVDAFGIQVRF